MFVWQVTSMKLPCLMILKMIGFINWIINNHRNTGMQQSQLIHWVLNTLCYMSSLVPIWYDTTRFKRLVWNDLFHTTSMKQPPSSQTIVGNDLLPYNDTRLVWRTLRSEPTQQLKEFFHLYHTTLPSMRPQVDFSLLPIKKGLGPGRHLCGFSGLSVRSFHCHLDSLIRLTIFYQSPKCIS